MLRSSSACSAAEAIRSADGTLMRASPKYPVVRVCRGGASCDRAGAAASQSAISPVVACRQPLVIDHHAPRNPPDRDRDERGAAPDVDDRDVVAEAVGHEQRLLVARE